LLTTLLSLAMSPQPELGRAPIRKFILVAVGLLAVNFVNRSYRVKVAYRLLLGVASLEAGTAFVQVVIQERKFLKTGALSDDPMALARVKGFMGHWMTFSGGQLLIWCAMVPLVFWIGRRWLVPLALVGVALIFSYTRSAWLGASAGFLVTTPWQPRKQI